MDKYNFDFNVDTKKMIRVSVMKLGLIFNSETIKVLGYPKKINIGIDATNKVIGIRNSAGKHNVKDYDFAKTGNEKWIRVNSIKLVKAIENITKKIFDNKTVAFNARYDKAMDMLIVDLSKGE